MGNDREEKKALLQDIYIYLHYYHILFWVNSQSKLCFRGK